MRRLFATFRCDVTLQARNRFYAVTAFVVVFWTGLLHLLPVAGRVEAGAVVPAFLMFNLILTTFYFVGALVLLEKSDGVLTALVTSPLRDVEYLGSKVLTLTLLATVESLLLVVLVLGTAFRWELLLTGTLLLGALYTLIGFITIARYDALHTFLMPSIVVVTFLVLPVLVPLGTVGAWLYWLHPVGPAFVLMEAAFRPVGAGLTLAALAGGLAWLGVCVWLARRRFAQYFVQRAGV